MMLSISRKRFLISLGSLFYHTIFTGLMIYALIRMTTASCKKPDFIMTIYMLGNAIWLISDWYGVLSIHPSQYEKFDGFLLPDDEEQIRKGRDNTFNLITYLLKFIVLGIACYSYYSVYCFQCIDIMIIVETGIYLVVITIEYCLIEPYYRNKGWSVNDEAHPLI